jgi:hypothetical protein
MSAVSQDGGSKTHWVSVWISAVLVVSALMGLGYRFWTALSVDDTDVLESPLAMSVARELTDGPSVLYGPFGGRNPLVLIHAPLYYRLAAILAWPLYRSGFSAIDAALIAGRALSFLGLIATLVAAYRLGRLGGLPGRAGWWSALLIAASPVLGGMPVTVRADMLGIALQTMGISWLLAALAEAKPKVRSVVAAYVAFGLAACVKQHLIVVSILGTVILLASWLRGRVDRKVVERAIPAGILVLVLVYGADELLTRGQTWSAVVDAASHVGQSRKGGMANVSVVFVGGLARLAVGLIPALAATAVAYVGQKGGLFRRLLVAVMSLWMVFYVFVAAVDSGHLSTHAVVILVTSNVILHPLLFCVCWLVERRRMLSGLDAIYVMFVVGELALLFFLTWSSTGAWFNYGIGTVVFASIIAGRLLQRAVDAARSVWVLTPMIVSVLLAAIGALGGVVDLAQQRAAEQETVAVLTEQLHLVPGQIYFDGRPGLNRRYGRPELVFDDWLYPVFESAGLAERRSVWLRRWLMSGKIGWLVCRSTKAKLDGIDEPLTLLRFRPRGRVGQSYVWERVR